MQKQMLQALIDAYNNDLTSDSLFIANPKNFRKGLRKRLFHTRTRGILELEEFLRSDGIKKMSDDQHFTSENLKKLLLILEKRDERISGSKRSYENYPDKSTNKVFYCIYEQLWFNLSSRSNIQQSQLSQEDKECIATTLINKENNFVYANLKKDLKGKFVLNGVEVTKANVLGMALLDGQARDFTQLKNKKIIFVEQSRSSYDSDSNSDVEGDFNIETAQSSYSSSDSSSSSNSESSSDSDSESECNDQKHFVDKLTLKNESQSICGVFNYIVQIIQDRIYSKLRSWVVSPTAIAFEKDIEKGLKLLKYASENGDNNATFQLARIYAQDNKSVSVDNQCNKDKALKYLKLAGEQGNLVAKGLYENGAQFGQILIPAHPPTKSNRLC